MFLKCAQFAHPHLKCTLKSIRIVLDIEIKILNNVFERLVHYMQFNMDFVINFMQIVLKVGSLVWQCACYIEQNR